jgi:hypothetical protein
MRYKIVINGHIRGRPEDAIVRAVVRGQLAIHPAHKAPGWCLTHIPTGRQIAEFVNCHKARRAYRAVAHLDWSFTQMEGPHYQKRRAVVVPAIRQIEGEILS